MTKFLILKKYMQLIKEATENKLRGGFYTPELIAEFILKWSVCNKQNSLDILEPSCGDGIFLKLLKKNEIKYNSLTAIELDEEEFLKAKNIGNKNAEIINMDFHSFCLNTEKRFDLIVGNPPYIRYQYFNEDQQNLASSIFLKSKLKYSKLANAWVSFVVGSSQLLKDRGKLAFVLPAELLQVSYAQQIREFISVFYNKISIVSFEKLVFPNIQQEVVLLLCEKDGTDLHKINHIEVEDAIALGQLDLEKINNPQKKIDFKNNKWTFYFLEQEEIDFIEKIQTGKLIPELKKFANVEVGITTGANSFFTVSLSTIKEYNLEDYGKPLVGRSVQVPSVIFTKNDWEKNRELDIRTHLLSFPTIDKIKDTEGIMDYILLGEKQKINEGYKCKIRPEWQIVPSQRISEAFFIRRSSLFPRLIINEANAFTTDTMHRVSVNEGQNLKALTASYYNSLSFAMAEVCGRSHGGGVLELMPNEVEKILVPYHENNEELLQMIDKMIRDKKDVSKILEVTDKKILQENYNFTDNEVSLVHNIWRKLSKRRLNRSKNRI